MGIYVYVGNLGAATTEESIRKAFTAAGSPVKSVAILRSSQNDRSRGFGFVEVGSEDEATAAIGAMNGVEVDGQALKVNQARVRALRSRTDGRSFESYSGLGGRTAGGPRRTGGGARRKTR